MKISIVLEALTGIFETDIKRASKSAEKAAKQMEADFKRAGVVLGGFAAAGAAALTALTKAAINNADEIAKMSQRVGVSVESLSTLAYTAEQSGVEIGTLQSSLVKLAKNASDAAKGTGEAVNGFEALGISVKNADGSLKDTDVLLKEVATQFAKYEDGANKTALAVNIFGRAGAELIPLLNEGAEGIGKLEKRARALGLEIDQNTAKKAEEFNDLMSDLSMLAKGFGNDLARELLPSLTGLAESFVDAGVKGREAAGGAKSLADSIKTVVGVTIAAVAQIQKFAVILAAVDTQIDTIGDTIGAKFNLFSKLNPGNLAGGIGQKLGEEIRKFSSEALDIGPIDAFTKALSSKFGEAGKVIDKTKSNWDALKDGFKDIDESALKKFEALFSTLNKPNDSGGSGGQGQAPGIGNFADRAKEAAEALKEWSEQQKLHDQELMKSEQITIDLDRANAELQARFDAQASDIENEIMLLGLNTAERERAIIALEAERLARDDTGQVIEEQRKRYEELLTQLSQAQKIAAAAREFESIWTNAADGVGDALEIALFDGAEAGADAIKDVMENLARDLVRFWLQQKIIIPIQQQMMGGGIGGGGGIGSLFGMGQWGQFGSKEGWDAASSGGPPVELAGSKWFGGGSGMSMAGNALGAAAGIYGVFNNFKNGPGGLSGGLSGAASGAMAGSMIMPGIGTIVGGIVGGLSGLLGGSKDPDIRLGGVGVTRKPENTFTTAFGQQQIGTRGDWDQSQITGAVAQFDQSIADMLKSIDGGSDQIAEIGGALSKFSVDLKGDSATIENILGERFKSILSTFDADIQQVVRGAGDLQSQVAALAEELARPEQLKGLLDSLAQEEQLAGMTEAERKLFEVNARFDETAKLAKSLGASQEELAQVESHRQSQIERLTNSQSNLTDELERQARIQDILASARGDLGVDTRSQRDQSIDAIVQKTNEYLAQLQDVGNELSAITELEQLRTDAIAEANRQIDAEINGFLDSLAFDLNIDGLSELEIAQAKVNQQYDAHTEQLKRQGATDEQLARLGDLRIAALDRETQSLQMATAAVDYMSDRLSAFSDRMGDLREQFSPSAIQGWINSIAGFTPQEIADALSLEEVREQVQRKFADETAALNLEIGRLTAELGGLNWWDQEKRGAIELQIQSLRDTLELIGDGLPDALEYVNDIFAQRLNDLLGGLRDKFGTIDPIAEVNTRFNDLIQQARDFGATQEEIAEIEGYRTQALLDANEKLMEEDRRRYEAELDYARSLRGFVDDLLLDDQLSTLTPQQRLAEAESQFKETLALANAGDEDARNRLQGLASSYLNEARNMFSSGQQYTDIFNGVTQSLLNLASSIDTVSSGPSDEGNWVMEPQSFDDESGFSAAIADTSAPVVARLAEISQSSIALPDIAGATRATTTEIKGLREDSDRHNDALVLAINRLDQRMSKIESATSLQTNVIQRGIDQEKRRVKA